MGAIDLIWIGHSDECAVLVTDGTHDAREVLKAFQNHVERSKRESSLVVLLPAEARALAGKLLSSARLVEAQCHAEERYHVFPADAALSDAACRVFDGE